MVLYFFVPLFVLGDVERDALRFDPLVVARVPAQVVHSQQVARRRLVDHLRLVRHLEMDIFVTALCIVVRG